MKYHVKTFNFGNYTTKFTSFASLKLGYEPLLKKLCTEAAFPAALGLLSSNERYRHYAASSYIRAPLHPQPVPAQGVVENPSWSLFIRHWG